MPPDPAQPTRELLDHSAAALERLVVAVRRGLPPASLAMCQAHLVGIHDSLSRLASAMAQRALEERP